MCQGRINFNAGLIDGGLATTLAGTNHLFDGGVSPGIEVLQRQVLELSRELPHPKPIGDRGVDFQGLAGDALATLVVQGAEGAHVVQPIAQFDDNDADVLGHRHEHLAKRGDLGFLPGVELELADLADTVDQMSDVFPEPLAELLEGDRRVFYYVVENRSDNGATVHTHAAEDAGNSDRV